MRRTIIRLIVKLAAFLTWTVYMSYNITRLFPGIGNGRLKRTSIYIFYDVVCNRTRLKKHCILN